MADYPDDLTPFIDLANLLVTEELSDFDTLSDERLVEIERWLSAHFAAVHTPLTTQESAKVSASFQRGAVGMGLLSTQYGQQAVALDSSGTLNAMAQGVSVMPNIESYTERWQENLY